MLLVEQDSGKGMLLTVRHGDLIVTCKETNTVFTDFFLYLQSENGQRSPGARSCIHKIH